MVSKKNIESVLILPNIRSTYNVGAIFRTADAVGVSKIYLVGITPTPVDMFGRERKDIAKSALGAQKSVPWEYKKTLRPLITKLKKEGYYIVAIEQSLQSIDYKKITPKKKTAFLLGEEVCGLSEKELSLCDVIAEIPMHGSKESLNVSVASGVALFRILDC